MTTLPKRIETLIFLDFETTGIIDKDIQSVDPLVKRGPAEHRGRRSADTLHKAFHYHDLPSKVPRITEIAMVSVPRTTFVDTMRRMAARASDDLTRSGEDEWCPLNDVTVPTNSLTVQLNPCMDEKQWKEYEDARITKPNAFRLSRADLEPKNGFEVEWPTICEFLRAAPKPACLIAHNGVDFDFRVLMQEFVRYEPRLLVENPLPDGVYMLDTLLAFIDVERSYHGEVSSAMCTLNWSCVTEHVMANTPPRCASASDDASLEDAPRLLDRCEDGEVPSGSGNRPKLKVETNDDGSEIVGEVRIAAEKEERFLWKPNLAFTLQKTPTKQLPFVSAPTRFTAAPRDSLMTPPQTPRKRTLAMGGGSRSAPCGKSNACSNDAEGDPYRRALPLRFFNGDRWSPAKKRRVRPEFFMRQNDGNWSFNKKRGQDYLNSVGTPFSKQRNFALTNIHQQIIRDDYDAHRAQADCEALLRVCAAYGDDFLRHLDEHSAPFPSHCYAPPKPAAGNSDGGCNEEDVTTDSI